MVKKLNTTSAVIILMIIVSFAFYFMVFYDALWVFFLCNFIIGITNAGVRILRTTYLFNQVPNNIIGRTNSIFNTLNIVVRMLLIAIFTFPFFQIDSNIRFGYLVGLFLMLLAIIILIIWHKKITQAESN